MKHTANIIKSKQGIITSLLSIFSMFELRFIDHRDKLEVISTRCINCKKVTDLYLRNSTFEEMITKFGISAILHHVGMS